jgi:hypothetical protein
MVRLFAIVPSSLLSAASSQLQASASSYAPVRLLRSRRTDEEFIPVSHAVRHANVELMGVLVAVIDVQTLERIWKDVGLRADDRIDLVGEDGETWFSWPRGAVTEHATGPSTSWSHPIPGWPTQVVATLDQAAVDRHSFGAKRDIVIPAAAGSVLVGLFCLVLVRRGAANEAVKARLLATIDAVPVEFIEYDREQRLILTNRAARLSQGWIGEPTGKTRRELLEESLAQFRAQYPDQDWDGWMAKRLANVEPFGRPCHVAERGTRKGCVP